jgi:hypothetical protein
LHDDNKDARFCIRSIDSSSVTADTIREFFNVDNGDTTINTANATITKSGTDENQGATLFFGTPYANIGAYKTAIIAEGFANWSRSRLHFCLNDVADNTRPAQNAGTHNIRMTMLLNGNVGIGNSRPNLNLDVGSTNAYHNIGRALIYGFIHNADKRDRLSIGRWDGSGAYTNVLGIRYNVSIGANDGYSGADDKI